jgi:hypothetical protein
MNPLDCGGLLKQMPSPPVAECVKIWSTVITSYPWAYFLEALSYVDFANLFAQQVAVAVLIRNPACKVAILDALLAKNQIAGMHFILNNKY